MKLSVSVFGSSGKTRNKAFQFPHSKISVYKIIFIFTLDSYRILNYSTKKSKHSEVLTDYSLNDSFEGPLT